MGIHTGWYLKSYGYFPIYKHLNLRHGELIVDIENVPSWRRFIRRFLTR